MLFLWQLAEKYGNVYSLKLGSSWVVVLNGFDAVQEGLVTNGDILADRPVIPLHTDVLHDLGKDLLQNFDLKIVSTHCGRGIVMCYILYVTADISTSTYNLF